MRVRQDTKDKENYVIVEDKYRRKLYQVAQNIFYIKFNNKKIHLVRSYDWGGYYYLPFNYLKDKSYRIKYGWDVLGEKLQELAKECQIFKREDAYVPSAPDTTKFMAVKSGDIRVEKNYYRSGGTYGISKYFPYIFIIGTNTKIETDERDKLLTLLLNGILSGLTIDNKPPFIEIIGGSAWVGYGLAK